jgi:hypothetical protein
MLSRYQNDSHEKFGGFLMFTVGWPASRFNEILKMTLGSNVIGQKTKNVYTVSSEYLEISAPRSG